nr:baseplate assembly protein [Coxiellaceae bacterium]
MNTGIKPAFPAPSIDLSQLPKPAVVEPLAYEAILDRIKQDFLQRATNFSDRDLSESDPVMKLLEVAAWRELLLRQRINEAARANLLAFAAGSDLDHLAAFYGVRRLAGSADGQKTREKREESDTTATNSEDKKGDDIRVTESDTALRWRLQAKIAGSSTAGSRDYYRYHALSSSSRVKDARCDSPEAGVVRIAILAHDHDGLPDEALLNMVRDRVTDDAVRVLTDTVEVVACEAAVTPIMADVRLKPEAIAKADTIARQAQRQCREQLACHRALGWSLTRSWIIAQCFVAGMESLELITPASDVMAASHQIVIVSDIDLRCRRVA